MRFAIVISAFIALIIGPSSGHSHGKASWASAKLITGKRSSFDKQLKFPTTEGDISIVVKCRGHVEEYGRFRGLDCYYIDDIGWLAARAIQRAARTAKVVPAVVDNEKTHISINFAVRFVGNQNEHEITVYESWDTSLEALEDSFVAPQRYSHGHIGSPCWRESLRFSVRTTVTVNVNGTAKDVSLSSPKEGLSSECAEILRDIALNSYFIPALRNGEPVVAEYVRPGWVDGWVSGHELTSRFQRPRN